MFSLEQNKKVISVTSLNLYLKNIIEEDFYLNDILVKGEISNFKHHNSGHLYFTLKDDESRIKCVMFKFDAMKVAFQLEDGQKIILGGKLGVYSANGEYQIYAKSIEKDGLGNLYMQLEKLKIKLQKEGLFADSIKKDLPMFPFKIGVISAKEGAAIKDVVTTINRRWPVADVILFPSLVQGETAPTAIMKALKLAEASNLDLIILTRGGGSIEDLWAFNDEDLAYFIASLKTPIISAIGHEVDFTIAEFVSDKRAPTPTAAAEIATPNISEVLNNINELKQSLNKSMTKHLENLKLNLIMNQNELDLKKYKTFVDNKILAYLNTKNLFLNQYNLFLENYKQSVKSNKERLILVMNSKLVNTRNDFINNVGLLDSLSPLKILKRGYASVKINNKILKDAKDIKKDDVVDIKLGRGSFQAKVLNKKEDI